MGRKGAGKPLVSLGPTSCTALHYFVFVLIVVSMVMPCFPSTLDLFSLEVEHLPSIGKACKNIPEFHIVFGIERI